MRSGAGNNRSATDAKVHTVEHTGYPGNQREYSQLDQVFGCIEVFVAKVKGRICFFPKSQQEENPNKLNSLMLTRKNNGFFPTCDSPQNFLYR